MANNRKHYRSKALRSLHKAMNDLHEVGTIDTAKKVEFGTGCLKNDKKKKASKTQKLRERRDNTQIINH